MKKEEAIEKITTVSRSITTSKPSVNISSDTDPKKLMSKVIEDKIAPLKDSINNLTSKSLSAIDVKQDSMQTNYDPSGK